MRNHVITHRENEKKTLQNNIFIVSILNMSISMGLRSVTLVPSFFSRQNASKDTHDDPNEPSLQFDPGGHDQGHHIALDVITCGVTPPKWAVLPECCQFSENLLCIVA